jgi:C4-dicarboxylate-specific signal transduction histidine kinase
MAESVAMTAIDPQSLAVDLHKCLCSENPLVLVNRLQLQQVLAHLVWRACESIAARPESKRQLTLATALAGERVEIVVSDGGTEEPADEPTTGASDEPRLDGRLVISRVILEAHGGSLSIASHHDVAYSLSLPRFVSA